VRRRALTPFLTGFALLWSGCSAEAPRSGAVGSNGGSNAEAAAGGATNGGVFNAGASGGGVAGALASTAGAAGTAAGGVGGTDTAGTGGAATSSAGSAGLSQGGAPSGERDLSTDRQRFFGASRCAGAGVQLCEDFESGSLDASTWTVLGANKPAIGTEQAARGSHALHLKVSGGGLSAIREAKTFPAAKNSYYGRAFVYFTSLPQVTSGFNYSHWTIIGATGSQVSGEIRVGGQLQGGANHWGVGTDSGSAPGGTGDWTNSDRDPSAKPEAVPTAQWLCIEWLHDGEHNETRFWWDGVEHPSLHTEASTPHGGNSSVPYVLPKFQQVWLGWQEYQSSSQTFELWLDEIAIDGARIGCVL
jgi:hypothetical protein